MPDLIHHNGNQPSVTQQTSQETLAENCLKKWMGWTSHSEAVVTPMWNQPQTCIAFNASLDDARALLPAMEAIARQEEENARPATKAEILTELELLESRYHRADHDKATAKELARQWVLDLQEAGVTIGFLRERCKAWRMSDSAFAPRSAGQLLGGKSCEWMASYAANLRAAINRIKEAQYAVVLTNAEVADRRDREDRERAQEELRRKAERAKQEDALERQREEQERNRLLAQLDEAERRIRSYEHILATTDDDGMKTLAKSSLVGSQRLAAELREQLGLEESEAA